MDKKRKRKRKKNTLTCRTGSDELEEEVVVVPASQRDAVCDQALAGGAGEKRSETQRLSESGRQRGSKFSSIAFRVCIRLFCAGDP
jgi:hypothetical protein